MHGPSLARSEFVSDGVIHHELEMNDQISISASNWIEPLAEAETLGIPAEMWPDYITSIDLSVDEVIAKNKSLREELEELGVTSGGRGKKLDFVLGLIAKVTILSSSVNISGGGACGRHSGMYRWGRDGLGIASDVWVTQEQEGLKGEHDLHGLLLFHNPEA